MKTIKIKTGILLNLISVFNGIYKIAQDPKMKLGAGIRFKLDLIAPEMNKVARAFGQNRDDIFKQHANLDENGKIRKIENADGTERDDISEEGVKLMNDLLNTEVEFQIPSLAIKDIESFEFSPSEWAIVKLLIDTPEEQHG